MMRIATAGSILLVGLLVAASGAEARCDAAGADAADVAAARAAIDASCDCAGAATHGAYVRCARAAARVALANRSCLGAVVRCAARSTCGKPGAVACCQTSAKGTTHASLKRNADLCRAPRGGSACVSPHASLCDACTAGGCATLPTPTPAPTPDPTATPPPGPTPSPGCGNGIVDPGEECDGATCSATLNGETVVSTCGAPGTIHACECRSTQCGGCIDGFTGHGALCWSDDQCLVAPTGQIGCIDGTCVPTRCDGLDDCSDVAPGCEGGLCCAAPVSGSFCRAFDMITVPCCGAGICVGDSLARCCMPAGEICFEHASCCSGSCSGGTCD